MDTSKPCFVLVHGGFHGAWTWAELSLELADAGYSSLALDLPGAGSLTQFPDSFFKRPVDLEAFAKEMSPVRHITQTERTLATVAAVNRAANLGNGKVVLLGHSWGGLTISHVAQAIPEKLQSLVYLTAILVANGEPGGAIFEHSSFAESAAGPLFIGAVEANGAVLRIDPRADDPQYVHQAQQAFYHDVPLERLAAITNLLHCDEPENTATAVMDITQERYGQVKRHYIRMADDRVLPPAAQDHMLSSFDRSGIGGVTTVHHLRGGHSPMFAQPTALKDVLVTIARDTA